VATNRTYTESDLLRYLPDIYSEDPFLGQFLSAFEKLLTGRSDIDLCYQNDRFYPSRTDPGIQKDPTNPPVCYPGLEETIAGVASYFEADNTPEDFLKWLSGWVALSLRADVPVAVQRTFIGRAVRLYNMRGTVQGIKETINIYVGTYPAIDEMGTPFEVGVSSTIGENTLLDSGAPHFFRVTLNLNTTNEEQIGKITQVVTSILDLEKPAHTFYSLTVVTPTLVIGEHSTIGEDTLLGVTNS
jgi:phage tail-like protein